MNTAANISAARWATPKGLATFSSGRCFGVVDAEGRMLSTDGVNPSTWGSLSVARQIAEFSAWGDDASWIAPA